MDNEIRKQEEREEGIRNQIRYGNYSYNGSNDPKNIVKIHRGLTDEVGELFDESGFYLGSGDFY